MVQDSGKTVWHFLNKTKHTLILSPRNPTPGYLSHTDENQCSLHKNLYPNVYSGSMHDCPKMEKPSVVQLVNG